MDLQQLSMTLIKGQISCCVLHREAEGSSTSQVDSVIKMKLFKQKAIMKHRSL